MMGGLSSDTVRPRVLDAELLDYIGSLFGIYGLPGLAVAVVHADSPAEFANWGIRNEDGDVMTSDTLVTIASCSKAFVTAAMGVLLDDFALGRRPLPNELTRVDWDTPVVQLLPEGEWKMHPEFGIMSERMTLREMLSHRTGLHRHFLSYGEPGDSVADIVHRLRYQRPAFEPRTHWLYCNPMYLSAQRILDAQTGSFIDFVESRIFKLLGMDAMYSPEAAIATGRAAFGFTKHDNRALSFFYNKDNYQVSAGPGGVIASAEGLACARWVRMLLHAGVNPESGETVIPKDAFEAVTTACTVIDGKGSSQQSIVGYGMGWFGSSYHGHDIVYHGGNNSDTTTLIMFAPHDRVGLVLLINQETSSQVAVMDIGWAILRKAFGIPLGDLPKQVPPKTSEEKHGCEQASNDREPAPAGLTGTYHSAGQGSPITLFSPSSSGPEAENVLPVFRTMCGELAADDLYAALPRAWGTHLRLVHLGGARFALRFNWYFPEGHGKDKSPFALHEEDEEYGVVEFVIEGERVVGFGLTGTAEEETVLERRGGRLQDIADAWFDKL